MTPSTPEPAPAVLHPVPEPGGVWLTTPRLTLRRPVPDDLEGYRRVLGDPRTYAHAPASRPDAERCRERLEEDLEAWRDHGVGYAAVVDTVTGELVGWAGLRRQRPDGRPALLNLYHRLVHARLGQGLGRELARALVTWALEWREEPVGALVDEGNHASLATCRSAGLVEVGVRPHADGKPMVAFEAPVLTVVGATTSEGVDRDEVLDLWMRVNDAGGAVGFVPGTPRADVAVALDAHLEAVQSGRALLVTLRAPDAGLLALGFWLAPGSRRQEHVAWLVRLMVDPERQGRNLGRLTLAAMTGVARRELPHVRLLRLDYRGGLGLGRFYEANGWTEVGRIAEGLWMGGDDYRDDVAMARRVDGAPLVPDGGY